MDQYATPNSGSRASKKAALLKGLLWGNALLAGAALALHESQSLLTVLFHSLFQDPAEIAAGLADPQQQITVPHFRRFIEYFLAAGYRFISPDDLSAGIKPGQRCMMITFDDGYFNNLRAAPVLQEYKTPAVFFISTDHVRENKAFWWDVLFREGRRAGKSECEIASEISSLKLRRSSEIDAILKNQLGAKALQPASDIDRPMTPAELRDFAREPYVFLGNHTADHAILTNYSPQEIRAQIDACQNGLREMASAAPTIIAYPNGNYTPEILDISRQAGMRFGITVDLHKNGLPMNCDNRDAMKLGRFVLSGQRDIESQCRVIRSDVNIEDWLKTKKRRKKY